MTYIDDLGFHRTTRDQYQAELEAEARAIWGDDINLAPGSPDARHIGMFAGLLDELAGVAEDAYNARSPAGATGAALARLSLINGVRKKPPSRSVGEVTLSGTPNVLVPAGSRIGSSAVPSAIFQTVADATIGGGGSVVVQVQSVDAGPVEGAAGALTKVLSVVAGWTGVTNVADVVKGQGGETDPALRVRRTASVALPSQGLVDGLRAALLQPASADHLGGGGCQQAVVLENPTDSAMTLADTSTLPPHSIQAITLGGLDADIAQTIQLKRAPGCSMIGAQTATVLDAQELPHTINWDQATQVPIYVQVHTPSPLPTDVQDAIRAAFVAWGSGLLQADGTILAAGQEPTGPIVPAPQIGGAMPAGPGTQGYVLWSQVFVPLNALLRRYPTLFVTAVDIGTSPSPTLQNNVALNHDEIADFSNPANVTFASP